MRWLRGLTIFGLAYVVLVGRSVNSQESTAEPKDVVPKKQAEEAMLAKALGRRRNWVDVYHFRGWRIQHNVSTKRHQLLDPKDIRQTEGSFTDCQLALKNIREKNNLARMTGSAVIMIHGLMQSSKCMSDMGATLRDAGYTTVDFDYPSTQITIPEAARYLGQMVEALDGFDEINFVVHSMGGLVVRAYHAEFSDPRIKRLVMLGTPNQGAELADLTQKYWIVRTVSGPGARQLGTRSDGLIPKLPVPDFEFAVIAGSRGKPSGWNPFIPGDDDGTVTVASTKLPGATDFSTVYAVHSKLLENEEAIAQTISFLKEGRLHPDREVQPIREDDITQPPRIDPKLWRKASKP